MSSRTLAALISLPLGMWALVIIAIVFPTPFAQSLRRGLSASTKADAISPARAWARGILLIHLLVLWLIAGSSPEPSESLVFVFQFFRAPFWPAVAGIFVGLAACGLLPLLRLLLPAERRFRALALIGLDRSLLLSTATLFVAVFVEEFWRVTCMRALLVDGYSPGYAMVTTSIAYGIAFASFGISTGLAEGTTGAIYAALFLWSRSFLIPLFAHLTVQSQLTALLWAATPAAAPADRLESPARKCPACGTLIVLNRFARGVSFQCPSCAAPLSFADSRTAVIRWGGVFVQIMLAIVGYVAFTKIIGEGDNTLFLAFFLSLPAYFSVFMIFQFVFPPKLQYGKHGFIGLDLNRKMPDELESKRDEDPKPHESDLSN
jgi:hypothetical protein